MMNGRGKSDKVVVPEKPSNKADQTAAEKVEGRTLAKGNSLEDDTLGTQGPDEGVPHAFERIRRKAKEEKGLRFTSLMHHVYDVDNLLQAYLSVKRDAVAGIDGETWEHYGESLLENLRDLSGRLRRGAYRAKPVRRAYILKADGRQRPLGVPTLEDKIVQRATVEVLNAIYEQDFLGFSYGFRPGRNCHQALDALTYGIETKKVNWVLDADIRSFFDTLNHEWLIKFVEHRIGDERVVRLIRKWLNAGVLEEGRRIQSEEGTVQGGSISPLLANVYLHYVFDLWIQQWRNRHACGDVIVVRYADDFVVGFEHRSDAERFHTELRTRFEKFGLSLHPEKTRLIEFGSNASRNRQHRGEGKPATFDFLGFTHICAKTRKGGFTVRRKTMRKKMGAKLQALAREVKRRMHLPIPKQGAYLRSVIQGHYRYYGVPRNYPALEVFRSLVGKLWCRILERRSQKAGLRLERKRRLVDRWLPKPRIYHPWPNERFRVTT
jgi:RNA-directed DNA polymerase